MTDDVAPSGLPPGGAASGPEITDLVLEPAFVGAAERGPMAAPPAPVWPRVGALLSGSLDLVTQSRIPLRNASLYIGLLGVLTMGASLLTLFAPGVDLFADPPTGIN